MNQRSLRNQKGFTLVEIAIVLVIVGLLLGGVLKGQEMIKQAKVKKVMKIADEVRSAVSLHLDKQGALPGDAAADTPAGNVNGKIDGSEEPFPSMFASNVINSANAPKDPFGGDIFIKYYADNGATTDSPAGHFIVFPGVANNTDVADQLDSAYDDATTTTGSMGINSTDGFVVPL